MCILCEMAGKRSHAMTTGVKKEDFNEINMRSFQHTNRLLLAEQANQTFVDYMKGKKRWVSLHGHSEGSLLDGGARVKDILLKAKRMGQDAVAITDHGNMFFAVQAHKLAKEIGIKHIVGSELYLTPVGKSMEDKDFKRGEKSNHHLVVMCKNNTGYKNLCKLSSLGYTNGFYRSPRIDREALKAHKEGLIVTSTCVGGSIPSNAYAGDFYKAESDLEWFMKEFGDDFYVEIQNHGIEIEKVAFEYMREVAQKYSLRTIITADSHYLDETDNINHDSLLCIGTGQLVDQKDRTFKFDGRGYHYMEQSEIEALFPHDQEAIFRTGEIADKCDDTVIDFGDTKLPKFEVPTDKEFRQDFAEWSGMQGGGMSKWQ